MSGQYSTVILSRSGDSIAFGGSSVGYEDWTAIECDGASYDRTDPVCSRIFVSIGSAFSHPGDDQRTFRVPKIDGFAFYLRNV